MIERGARLGPTLSEMECQFGNSPTRRQLRVREEKARIDWTRVRSVFIQMDVVSGRHGKRTSEMAAAAISWSEMVSRKWTDLSSRNRTSDC